MISKEAVQPLGRYADILLIVGFLPVLGFVKFGHIIRHKRLLQERQRRAKKQREEDKAIEKEKAAKPKAKGKAESAAKAAEGSAEASGETELAKTVDSGLAKGVPPLAALILLLLAELCASIQIFDPADFQVRRALGVFGRARRSMKPGFLAMVEAVFKLLEDEDVYQVTRFSCMICTVTSLVVVVLMDMPRDVEAGNPFKASFQTIKRVVSMLMKPRLWLLAIIFICFTVGNRAALSKVIRRPAFTDLFNCSSHLLRAMAAAVMATGDSDSDHLPLWCTTQAVAGLTRAAFIFGTERASWSSLMEGTLTGSAAAVRGAVVMEAISAMFLLPGILRRRHLMLPVFLLLCVPCIAVFEDGQIQKTVEPLLAAPVIMQRSAVVLGVMSAMSLFMSGVPGVFSVLTLVQAFFLIHRLETVKI